MLRKFKTEAETKTKAETQAHSQMTEVEFEKKCLELAQMANGSSCKSPETLPEYYPGYRRFVEKWRQAYDHAHGNFPDWLIGHNKPMQSEEEFEYVRKTYQPKTKKTFLEFANTVKKTLANGRIVFKKSQTDSRAEDFETYLREGLPRFDSFLQFAGAMVDEKLIDANGLVGIWIEPPGTVIDEETGEEVISGMINPYPVMYDVWRVVWLGDDEYIVETTKGGWKQTPGQQKLRSYRYFGKEFLGEAIQVNSGRKIKFQSTTWFEHGVGFAPARRLGGNAVVIENEVHYESVFDVAVPFLNSAALDESNLRSVKNKSVFPTRVVVRPKCNYQSPDGMVCDRGRIKWVSDGVESVKECPSCHGSGYSGAILGPLSELVVDNRESGLGETINTGIDADNAMSYVSPPIETPQYLTEEIRDNLEQAQEVLHLKSQPRRAGAISATEKDRDAKNTEAFVRPISDQIWELIDYLVLSMGAIRYGRDEFEDIRPSLVKATVFDLLTPADYLQRVTEAKKDGMSPIVIQLMIADYLMSLGAEDVDAARVYDLALKADRLVHLTPEQVALMLSRRLIEPWEATMNASVLYFIQEEIDATKGDFWALELDEQLRRLEARAKAHTPSSELSFALPPPADL